MRVSLLDPSGPAARENARVSGVLLDPVSYWRSRPALPRSVAGEALGVGAPGMVTIKGGGADGRRQAAAATQQVTGGLGDTGRGRWL